MPSFRPTALRERNGLEGWDVDQNCVKWRILVLVVVKLRALLLRKMSSEKDTKIFFYYNKTDIMKKRTDVKKNNTCEAQLKRNYWLKKYYCGKQERVYTVRTRTVPFCYIIEILKTVMRRKYGNFCFVYEQLNIRTTVGWKRMRSVGTRRYISKTKFTDYQGLFSDHSSCFRTTYQIIRSSHIGWCENKLRLF